jgi:MFS family permease
MVSLYVPKDSKRTKQQFDFAGAGVMFLMMICLLFGLSISQERGFNNLTVAGLLFTALVALVVFLMIESKSPNPMINLLMFRNRQFSINLITGFLVFVCTAGMTLLFPLYLQNVLQYGSGQTGLMLAVTPLFVSFVAPLSGALSDRTGSRPITTLGLLIIIIGFFGVSTLSENTTTLGYLIRFIPIGIGIGLFQSPNNSAVMGSVSRDNLGVASSLLSLTRTLGQTTGIAVLSTVWENRVAFYNGGFLEFGATFAPIKAQVSGLQDTVYLSIALLILALSISTWALIEFLKLKNKVNIIN